MTDEAFLFPSSWPQHGVDILINIISAENNEFYIKLKENETAFGKYIYL